MTQNLKTSVVSGMKWLALSKFLIQLLRWGSTFWVIRLLNANDYGIMAIVGILTAVLISGNFLSIGNVIIRFKTISQPILNTLFTLTLVIGTVLTLIQFTVAPWFASFYETEQAKLVLQVMAMVYIVEAFAVKPMALLAKNMKFKELAKIDLAMGVITPISVLIAAYMDMGYWAIAIGLMVNSTVKTIASNLLLKTEIKLGFHFNRTRKLLTFGMQNSISSIIAEFNSQLDFIIGGYYFATSQIGIYSVGLQISFIPLRKLSPELRRIAFPAFSKISKEPVRVASYYLKSIRLISLFVFPLFFGLAMVAEPLIEFVLTNKWIESALIIQIICFSLGIRLLTETTIGMLNALGRSDIVLKTNLFSVVIFVLSIFPLLSMGISGMAWAWAISIFITYIKIIYQVAKIIPVKVLDIIMSFFPALLASVVMVIVMYFYNAVIELNAGILLVSEVALGCLIYSSVIFIAYRPLIKELRSVFSR